MSTNGIGSAATTLDTGVLPGDAAGSRTVAGLSPANLMLVFLALAYFLAYFDRMLMAAVGEMVKIEFALTDGQLSLLTGASFIVIYGIFNIVSGWLADRYSRKRIIVISLAVWSGVTMMCGLASSFIQLAIARAGVGIGESAIVPTAASTIRDTFPLAKRPMAVALFYTGGMVGILACFVLGTWIATEYGWRASFLVAGPPGLLLALLVALFAREPMREPQSAAEAAAGAGRSSYRLVFENRPLVWVLLAGATATSTNIGIAAWLPNFFLRSHDLTLQEVGMLFGPVLAAGMTVGMLLGGWVGNRIASKSVTGLIWLSAISMILIIPLFLLMFWLPSLYAALTATLLGTAMSVVYSPCFTAAWQSICHSRAQGTAAGLSGCINSVIGGGLYAFVVGVMSDRWAADFGDDSLRYALTAATLIFCLLAAALFVYAARLVKKQANERAQLA